MMIDQKIILIAVEALIIIVLLIILFVKEKQLPPDQEKDPYLQQLRTQTKELGDQLARLKKNYINLGLLDNMQIMNMDSLVAISNQKVGALREEAKTYREVLEEMKTREWKKLTETQKTKEIEDVLNFLKHDKNCN